MNTTETSKASITFAEFPPRVRVLVFSEGLDAPHIDFEVLIREWKAEGVGIDFVSWRHVKPLLTPNAEKSQLEQHLKKILRVFAPLPPIQS